MENITVKDIYNKVGADCLCTNCPYNIDGFCDDVFINNGNGDASCHLMSLLELKRIVNTLNFSTKHV